MCRSGTKFERGNFWNSRNSSDAPENQAPKEVATAKPRLPEFLGISGNFGIPGTCSKIGGYLLSLARARAGHFPEFLEFGRAGRRSLHAVQGAEEAWCSVPPACCGG